MGIEARNVFFLAVCHEMPSIYDISPSAYRSGVIRFVGIILSWPLPVPSAKHFSVTGGRAGEVKCLCGGI